MSHRHVDVTALMRATFRDKLRARRRTTNRHGIVSRHHRNETAAAERPVAADRV